MYAILTPLSEDKFYAGEDYIRGVRLQDVPKKEILWLFILQQQGLSSLPHRLLDLQSRVGHEYAGVVFLPVQLPYGEAFFGPERDQHLTWKVRAEMAAHLRAVGFSYLAAHAPQVTHTLSLGCDVVLHSPEDMSRLLGHEKPLVSGVILARVRGFPLVLRYYPETKTWDWWTDYPRGQPFIADWTGMDILMVSREVFTTVDLHQFDVETYRGGEDAWFCLEAKRQLNVSIWVDPDVCPYHVHQNGTALWAKGEVPTVASEWICPACATSAGISIRRYVNVPVICQHCKNKYYSDPWILPIFEYPASSAPARIEAIV